MSGNLKEKRKRKSEPKRRSEILLYDTPDGAVRVEVTFEEETFWLTQKRMAELFGVDVRTISYHLLERFKSKELNELATIRKNWIVQAEGAREVRREVEFYNLDAIIAVGYRVNSREATQFRIWATGVLREFLIKGFVLDDQRLEEGARFGKDYFDELLERIRSSRASERRFYLKITDIYEQCSIDYIRDAEITQTFFTTVLNKLHWATTGKIASELIAGRADAEQPNMGLTTWKNAPKGRILKSDVTVAKNYLNEDEMKSLEWVVGMYLDYAENQASQQIAMKMVDWISKLDAFLQFNEYEVLKNAGKVSHEIAKRLAEEQYESFAKVQDRLLESDFERATRKVLSESKEVK